MPTRCFLSDLAVVAMCFAAALAQAQEPVLTLQGNCPGSMSAEVSQAPSRHGLSLLYASETGSFRIPFWQFCQGVELGLGRTHLQEVAHGTTDESGFISFHGFIGARACGGYLQVLTYPGGGCTTSNVVQIK